MIDSSSTVASTVSTAKVQPGQAPRAPTPATNLASRAVAGSSVKQSGISTVPRTLTATSSIKRN